MTPQEVYDLLRETIPRRPELRYTEWPDHLKDIPEHRQDYATGMHDDLHPYLGHCYIATEVFCYLVPEAKPYCCGRAHFWAEIDGVIWDATFDQFEPESLERVYSEREPTRFKRMSKRAKELLAEVMKVKEESCFV